MSCCNVWGTINWYLISRNSSDFQYNVPPIILSLFRSALECEVVSEILFQSGRDWDSTATMIGLITGNVNWFWRTVPGSQSSSKNWFGLAWAVAQFCCCPRVTARDNYCRLVIRSYLFTVQDLVVFVGALDFVQKCRTFQYTEVNGIPVLWVFSGYGSSWLLNYQFWISLFDLTGNDGYVWVLLQQLRVLS